MQITKTLPHFYKKQVIHFTSVFYANNNKLKLVRTYNSRKKDEDEKMRIRKNFLISGLTAGLVLTTAITGFAATEHWNDNSANENVSTEWTAWKTNWEGIKNNYEQISLTPGADETELNFGWYSKIGDQAKIRVAATRNMKEAKVYEGTSKEYKQIDGTMYYSNKVTVTGITEETVYYYQYYLDGAWSVTYKYESQNQESFSFLYVGDPQIGASVGQTATGMTDAQTAEYAARNDTYSWNTTLESALDANEDVSFMISAGDQINETVKTASAEKDLQQEIEYAGFLSPLTLKSLPLATTIGNHDSRTANYQNHFNNPNSFTEETSATAAGNGYYFTYGDALFIMLNTNNYNCADHEALLKKAVEANPDAKWKVVTFHHDIYGSGMDHSDSDGIILRTQLTTLMDKYDIDVVLQGHDHTYSRSYQLTSDEKKHTAYDSSVNLTDETTKTEFSLQNQCYNIVSKAENKVKNPDGVLYLEANSATGSKFYNLIATQQDYIASRSQTWTPTYSVIDVTDTTLTVNTYDVETGKKIDEAYTIEKKKETKKKVKAKSIVLNKKSLELKAGKSVTLKATVKPKNTTDSIYFVSSNEKVATVGKRNGKVTAVKAGTCKIKITCGNKEVTCKVRVK